ncbi:hypothetical protein GCM10009555_003550 [Acrocarpospora macrocephala]|uniref:Orc1-like AAA ATPase domain-containing protein n=1 Tax=Acrocarpospora macrocephala TaxID=150177 RepID=A0A5M3X2D2_9ACTN|nr:tetratricopeptide repeat protein [Acrocarpospora macrocephala]GES15274.1 hypothetical protein Amac_088710 [Acrocarpospora macrocephala]
MRQSPVVDILARRDARPLALASGYLIAPGLVLTARHAVEAAVEVGVRLLGDDRKRLCRVAWRSPVEDVAVLAVTVEQDQVLAVPTARWGVYTGISAANPVEAMGFPWAQQAGDGSRDVEHLQMSVNSGAGWLSGRAQADIEGPVPIQRPDGLRWAGLSGAAVLAGDLIVGVVVEETPKYGARRLSVVPVRAFVFDLAFRTLIEQATGQRAVAEPAELAAVLTSPARVRPRSPAMLLRADAEAVGFYGRERELAGLRAWANAEDRSGGVRVRLYTGPGGQGKTRLARAFAHDLAGSWVIAVLADSLVGGGGQVERAAFARLASGAERLLVIVDYAETRAGQVLDLLRALAERGAPTRVLLLARSAGDWWQTLGDDLGELAYLADPGHVTALPVLDDSLTARQQAFTHAVTQLRTALNRLSGPGRLSLPAVPEPSPRRNQADGVDVGTGAGDGTPDLRAERYRTALDIQMAALVVVLGGSDAGGMPEQEILRHERRYWKSTALRRPPNTRVNLHNHVLARAVAMAALCGASTQGEALRLIAAVPGIAAGDEDLHIRVAVWLHELYPAAGDAYWGSLHPDLLAEYLVAAVTRENPGFLARALTEPSATRARHVLHVLARAALHQPDLVGQLTSLIGGQPDLARHAVAIALQTENPDPLLSALTEAVENMPRRTESLEPLWELAGALPARSRLLGDLKVQVYTTIGAIHLETGSLRTAADLNAFAAAATNLARQMVAQSRTHDALQGFRLAVGYYEWLAEQEPDLFLPAFASVLADLAKQLAKMGERHNATVAIQRALDISERLAAADPGAHRLLLASTLRDFAEMFPTSRTSEALTAMRRSVALYEQAAEEDAGKRPALAAALGALVMICATARLPDGALAHAQRAVDIYEPLAEADPDAYQEGLARSLNLLTSLLAHLGEHGRALDVAERMAPLWGELAVGSLARFGAGYLQVLLLLGFLRLEASRPVDAAVPLISTIWFGHPGAITLESSEMVTYQASRLLRAAYRMAPKDVAAEWKRITNEPVPEWLREQDADPFGEEVDWYRQAAETGDMNAIRHLAVLHDQRNELDEAARWYAKAAEAGDTMAMTRLGIVLRRQGRLEEAEPWWRRAAEAGGHSAMTDLALLLIRRDELDEAEAWSRRSTTFGDVRAMNVLGMVLMKKGEWVEAETWLRKAGQAGDVDAVNNLLVLVKIKSENGAPGPPHRPAHPA